MKTEDIIKELELNYGYTFAKEGTDNKWQFEWLCEMINDVQNVVTKNRNLHIVTTRTWLFSGWYAGDKFETKITAENRETAIAYFETDFPNHKWHMTQEIV